MSSFTSPLSSRRRARARALALAAAALALLALVRGASPPPAATDRRPGSDGDVPDPRNDFQHRTETPVLSSSPRSRRRRRLSHALALVVAAGVVALLALVVGPSTSRATIDWTSGFEGQSWGPWQGLQHQADKPLSDSFQFVTSPVRTGSYAAQFNVPHGYGPYGGERTELCCGPTSEGVPGTDEWWGWSTMFPTNWTEPYHWGLFFQFHAGDTTPPAIAFDAGADAVWVDVRTGDIGGGDAAYQNFPQILTTLSKGQWNDFVVHVSWSTTNGTLQVWHRLAGDAGFVQVLNLTGIPTLQVSNGASTGIYTKLGLYRDSYCSNPAPGCSSPLGVQPTNSLYDDSVVRGSSFDEVVSAAWGGVSTAVSSSPAPATPAPATPAPATPAPATAKPATAKPATAKPAGTPGHGSAGGLTTSAFESAQASASSAKRSGKQASKKGVAKAQATARAQARAHAEAVATAKARVRSYAAAAAALGAKAHGYSLAAAAARAKARAYYRAAARAQAKVRALTRPTVRPATQLGSTRRPS